MKLWHWLALSSGLVGVYYFIRKPTAAAATTPGTQPSVTTPPKKPPKKRVVICTLPKLINLLSRGSVPKVKKTDIGATPTKAALRAIQFDASTALSGGSPSNVVKICYDSTKGVILETIEQNVRGSEVLPWSTVRKRFKSVGGGYCHAGDD